MYQKKKRIFIAGPTILVMFLLLGCTQVSYNNCPVYPVAGEKVAKELESAGDLPNTWEWIGRVDKLRQELDLCKN